MSPPVTSAAGRATRRLLLGLLIVTLAGPLLGATAYLSQYLTAAGVVAADPVITPRQLRAQPMRRPQDWLGRIVPVRGILAISQRSTCPQRTACLATQAVLLDLDPAAGDARLPLAWGPTDPFLARLHALPLVGRLAPPAQELVWGRPAIYRLRIQRAPDAICVGCVEGLVLDAPSPNVGAAGSLERPTVP